ncbi:poly(A) polymerase type 3-like [Sabethes cyaneus]|uniref:poly(A) polymerase type 3-like n=1 Tax=Sabethes cyaneus TaxID=53552 RepID=UPI00237EB1F5|nr:poly(A) polymerase type 3-like [Sabethes cyaneus]
MFNIAHDPRYLQRALPISIFAPHSLPPQVQARPRPTTYLKKNLPTGTGRSINTLTMTSTINLAEPTPEDLQGTSELQNMPEAVADKLGGTVYPYGSYRLGAYDKNADIDALCVAPRNVERKDYFESFFELLKRQSEVTGCLAVQNAAVPIIKMNFDGIEIDLSFAQLNLDEIPDNIELCDDMLLKKLDCKSWDSLNGVRQTEEIIRLVPNIDSFRLALRVIKLWAKSRGIYSRLLGYLGGISWTIMVARTCQLYPNATAATLVHNFFLVFSGWDWPQPVTLKQVDNVGYDKQSYLMPIITPLYPHENTGHDVSVWTRQVIIEELHRGKQVTDEIMLTKAAGWDKLFAALSFFSKYRNFLVLLASSNNAADHLVWCPMVEWRIDALIWRIWREGGTNFARVFPKRFEMLTTKSTKLCSLWFIGLECDRSEISNDGLKAAIANFLHAVPARTRSLRRFKTGMNIDVRHVGQEQLSEYLQPNQLMRETSPDVNSESTTRKRLPSDAEQTETAVQSKKVRTDSETPTTSSELPPNPITSTLTETSSITYNDK